MRWTLELFWETLRFFAQTFWSFGNPGVIFLLIAIAVLFIGAIIVVWRSNSWLLRALGGLILAGPILFFLAIGGVVGKEVYFNLTSFTYHYRLGIDLEVDGRPVSGSSVITVQARRQFQIGTAAPWNLKATGEAAFIDLGRGRNLIMALRTGPKGNGSELRCFAFEARGISCSEGHDNPTFWKGRLDLKTRYIPTLITFANPNDPLTARIVTPDELSDVFGPGVVFKKAWIEMTSEKAVSTGIEKKIPWLNHTEDYRTDRKNPFTSTLKYGTIFFILR